MRPVPLVGYTILLVALTIASASQAGGLAGPVAIYGAGLSLMCLLATGVNRLVAIGAFAFLLSDIVLAVYFFVGEDLIPASMALNSATYLPAQLLIALGALQHVRQTPALARPVLARISH